MKKVLLEMERLRNPNSGLGQFCLNFGKELVNLPEQELIDLTFYLPDNQRLIFGDKVNYQPVSKWHKIFPISGNYDIWHCLHQGSNYLPFSRKTKLILTIADLNFLERKDYSKLRKWLKIRRLQQKINRASALTYISEFTKNTVHQHLKIPKGVIEQVIYLGVNLTGATSEENATSTLKKQFANQKFIFSVGIIQSKKNFHVILPILEKRKDLQWLLAGNNTDEYAQKIKDSAINLGVSERVHFLGKVQESEKYWLYQNCEAFVFPSLSEGFGLPVIEAMSLGKPVFLSRLTSLPEVGGKEAYYFDNFSAENIVEVFENGMKNFQNDAAKIEKSKNWAAQFNWKKTAEAYLALYKIL